MKNDDFFNSIASRYELVNTLISLGLWWRWNRQLVENIINNYPKEILGNAKILDLCCGTGIVTKELLSQLDSKPAIDCMDLSPIMLDLAKKNLAPYSPFVSYIQANATDIPKGSHFYDAITMAYGIRNIPLIPSIREMHRVLKKGGSLFMLELTQPPSFLMRTLHSLYLSTIAQWIGFACTHNKEAYQYLLRSIQSFSVSNTIQALQEEGFTNIISTPRMWGCLIFITATKK